MEGLRPFLPGKSIRLHRHRLPAASLRKMPNAAAPPGPKGLEGSGDDSEQPLKNRIRNTIRLWPLRWTGHRALWPLVVWPRECRKAHLQTGIGSCCVS